MDDAAQPLSATPSPFWEAVDAVCVINLAHRTDRWEDISRQLERCGAPAEKIHRIDAVWGKKLPGFGTHRLFRGCTEEESLFWAGRAGCLLSHRRCFEWAAAQGFARILILEDDAEFKDDLQGNIGAMLAETALHHPIWDLFYLGMTPYFGAAQQVAAVDTDAGTVRAARVMGPLCTHAYLAHERAFGPMLSLLPQEAKVWQWLAFHLSYDSWIANEYGRSSRRTILGCYPNICIQGASYSDIEHVELTHNQGALGGRAYPVSLVDAAAFEAFFRSPAFLLKKQAKIGAHYLLGLAYYLFGYRKFSVSIETAGYWGAMKAACRVLRRRKK